jgi:Flp pilus assembly protein TadD
VKSLTVVKNEQRLPARRGTLREQRGYARDDLFAIAEVAYNYLANGGVKLAVTLYEGLTAVAPDEPHFALGMGLAYDHYGQPANAMRWYKRASDLDPSDGRPDVNRAELYLSRRDFARAKPLLIRGAAKATNRGDAALAKKAHALLSHVDRTVRRR